jgi:type I restriction enzyme S subunit
VVGRKGSIGALHWSESPVWVADTAYTIDQLLRSGSLRFVYYLLRASRLADLSQDVGVPGLSRDAVHGLPCPAWSCARQREIADFLDLACERIDVSGRLIGRLMPTAASGYLSLARERTLAPEHPRVLLKLVATPGTGHTPSRERGEYWVEEDCHLPWFGLADVWQVRDDAVDRVGETAERISDIGLANSAAVKHCAGTVFMSRTASVGFVGQMAVDMAVTQDFMTWTCGPRLLPEYLLHALRATRPEILQMVQGSTHKTIYMPDLLGIKLPLPCLERQHAIVADLQPRLESRRRGALTAERLRHALTAYRASLIHEAVTGKLDVTKLSDRQMDERLHAAAEDRLDEVAAV